MAQSKRAFAPKLDFITSLGHGEGGNTREKLGLKTKGPTKLITDMAIFAPDPETKEMTIVSIHPGVTREQIEHFFLHYKDLEPGKWMKLLGWRDAAAAKQEILDSIKRYASATPQPNF